MRGKGMNKGKETSKMTIGSTPAGKLIFWSTGGAGIQGWDRSIQNQMKTL